MSSILGFFGQTTIDLPIALVRLLMSLIMGGLIGLEREWHRQSAGLRTHILISLGATLLTLLSIYIPQTHRNFQGGDPGRIAAQVITGIGFLGGGAIFRLGANVRGLTTAASIWIVAGIGMTVGAGMYFAALVGTGLVLFALFFMVRFEKRLFPARSLRKLEIVMRGEKVNTDGIFPLLKEHGIEIKSVGISQSYQAKTIRVNLTVQVPEGIEWNKFYREAGRMDGISKITLDEKI